MTDPTPNTTVAALRQSLADLITESQALRTDVRDAERARRRASQINLAVLGLLALFVALLIAIGWQGNKVIGQVHKTNETMADCTTPGGECYERSRQRTGDAIGDIIRANLYMAECARLFPGEAGPNFDRKLEECVYGRLAEAAKARAETPTPTPAPRPSPS